VGWAKRSKELKKSKRKGRLEWWEESDRLCRVYQGEEFIVFLHFPRWGPSVRLLSWCPADWGLQNPRHFCALFPYPEFRMKKPVQAPTGRSTLSASVDDLVERYPCLAEHVAANAYDGEPAGTRTTSTLLVFCQDGSWKACLHDRAGDRLAFVAGGSLMDVLTRLEAGLEEDDLDWRKKKPVMRRK